MASPLEQTALAVIRVLQSIPEYRKLRVAVIGGLTRMHYDPESRLTMDVNFIVEAPDIYIDKEIQKAILDPRRGHGFHRDFCQRARGFYHIRSPTQCHRVDFRASSLFPYLPPAARQVQRIKARTIPYISFTDLIVFKIYSCGLRTERSGAIMDAADVGDLLDMVATPLALTEAQQLVVEKRFEDFIGLCPDKPRSWYRTRLSLPVEDEEDDDETDDEEVNNEAYKRAYIWADEKESEEENNAGNKKGGEVVADERDDEEENKEGDKKGAEVVADEEENEEENKKGDKKGAGVVADEKDGEKENKGDEEGPDKNNTGLYFTSSFRLSLFGFGLLDMERAWMAGVV